MSTIRISIDNAKRLGVSTVRNYQGKQEIKNIYNGKIIKIKRTKDLKK